MFIFSYHIVNPPDGAWGRPSENGTWSGLIGHALYGKSNWSMAGIATLTEVIYLLVLLDNFDPAWQKFEWFYNSLLSQRENVIDFCFHYVPEYLDWVAAKPLTNPKWPAIFKPFTPETWTATAVVAGEIRCITYLSPMQWCKSQKVHSDYKLNQPDV
jgi:hypothetical protein